MKPFFSIFLFFLLLTLVDCGPLEELPVPHYMIERFANNAHCEELDFIQLEFPDSTLYISEDMDSTRFADGWGENEMSRYISLYDTLTVSIRFYDTEPIDYRYSFIYPGSYKFYNSYGSYDERQESFGVEVRVSVSNKSNRSLQDSPYFYVYGKSGDDYQMTICGEFDVLLGEDRIPVSGTYSLTYTDYFF